MVMHNLELSEEQAMIQETVRKLVADVAAPNALHCDEHAEFVQKSFEGLLELGLLGAAVGEDQGGVGLGVIALVVALEELGRACGSSARLLLGQGASCAFALAGEAGAASAIASILGGETVAAFVGPEHGVAATSKGAGFELRGRTAVVTAAGQAGLFVVAAKLDGQDSLFVLPSDRVAVSPSHSLGYRACAPATVDFDGVIVTADECVARGARASELLATARVVTHLGAAAIATGSALASIDHTMRHAKERIAFGKPLAKQEAVANKLVECRRRAEAARHLVFHAARLFDLGQDAAEAAKHARLSAIEAAVIAADEGIQIHGGYGYTVEYHVERHYRDAKTLEVLDGGAAAIRAELARAFSG
ncbi:MAG: acyl-CoA dehydrogenase family protein [Planctomycetota bacterium]